MSYDDQLVGLGDRCNLHIEWSNGTSNSFQFCANFTELVRSRKIEIEKSKASHELAKLIQRDIGSPRVPDETSWSRAFLSLSPTAGGQQRRTHGDARCRQSAVPSKVDVDRSRSPSAFIDGPNDQRLTSTAISRGKDSWNAR